jgi:alkylation response protein AidB-like acyl-CoA dehydrogenase
MSENEYPTHGDFCVACDENLSVICERCYKDLITKLTEARAEVERLRAAVHTRACRNQSAYNLNCVCGADERQRDLQKLAYRRGAEAMREAAANALDMAGQGTLCNTRECEHWGRYVRALPIPEEP